MARKMTLADKQRVIELEKRERFILKEINQILNTKNQFNYTMVVSTIDSDCPYDAVLTIKEQNTIVATFIIELKNRTNNWTEDGFILEKKKLNDLNKSKINVEYELGREVSILYISVTGLKSYIWCLDDFNDKPIKMKMNKETFAFDNKQVNKSIYLLQTKDAIEFNYGYDEQKYLNSLKPKQEIKKIEEPKSFIVSLF